MRQARVQLHRAVNDAEATCGLQFCVVLCSGDGDLATQGEAALDGLGVTVRPTVLVVVRLGDDAVEVTLGPSAEGRLDADDVAEVLELCPPGSCDSARERAAAIVLTLADRAGPGQADPDAPAVPDVVTT